MNIFKISFVGIYFFFATLSAAEITISSYNCGGLSDYYDYLRAVSMEKLMQERYMAEPQNMFLNEKIQALALKILFSEGSEKILALGEWKYRDYDSLSTNLTQVPSDVTSANHKWFQKANAMLTSYDVRPVVIFNETVNRLLALHLNGRSLKEVRDVMGARIIQEHLKHDIICLQEADYIGELMFSDEYAFHTCETMHSVNGIAFKKDRFEFIKDVRVKSDRSFAILLLDRQTDKTILVSTAHLSGCDPYRVHKKKNGGSDASKGDTELKVIVEAFDQEEADLKIIGMDSNVTALHPRLGIAQAAGYRLDYENHLEQTCTNPYQVLNTRIDWILMKTEMSASITNVPVLSVGLNNMQTNISDHKPIAAKIVY